MNYIEPGTSQLRSDPYSVRAMKFVFGNFEVGPLFDVVQVNLNTEIGHVIVATSAIP